MNLAVLLFLVVVGLTFVTPTARSAEEETGRSVDPLQGLPGDVVVLIFVGTECPISNRYAPTVNGLVDEFRSTRTRFFAIYAEESVTAQAIREHRKAYAFKLPFFIDSDFSLAKKVGASVTPEVAVYVFPSPVHSSPRQVYRGRIDDRYIALGRLRTVITDHDLRDVLLALAAGQTPAARTTQAIGCYLAPTNPK